MRRASMQFFSEISPRVVRFATVVEGDGLRCSIVRTLLAAANTMIRCGYPNRLFGTVESAVPWLLEEAAASTPSASEVTAAMQRLRSSAPVG